CAPPAPPPAACSASSTTPPWSASAAVWSPAASMIASGPRANATPRPCWPWPDGASTSCGRCCATSGPTGQHHQPPTLPDPLTRHHPDGLTTALGSPFLLVAGGPVRAGPATLLARSRLAGVLAGRPALVGAVGEALLGVNPLDGRAGPQAVGPLSRVGRLGAEGPHGVGDLVGAPVVLDLGGGGAPGPTAPGGRA